MRYHLWITLPSQKGSQGVKNSMRSIGRTRRGLRTNQASAPPLRTVLRTLLLPFSHQPKVLCADCSALLLFILAFTRALYKFFYILSSSLAL